ncbi:Rha family transcriptional regulator [Mycobacterium sp. SMC-4]|uniref:Rha family transcriptional regulator n=1 Tax=Mycobacterium sp. SMC-4 TaxID=2857059 RepID=UPI0021B2FFE8|nr:Rha family transcriptional regulator [Mycobacterium sp. SMC-4]UXA19491.1 Rha family transcriptional regulator [Mycobacterium sp. SMC-4]
MGAADERQQSAVVNGVIPDTGAPSGTFTALERTTPIVQRADDGTPTTTSMRVANGTKNEHASVLRLIRDNIADFEEFGLVGFEIQPRPAGQHGGGDVQIAILNEEHATLLLTYMRNNAVVKDFKKRLVREFSALRRAATPQTREERFALALAEAGQMLAEKDEQIAAITTEKKCLEAAIERDAPLVAKAEAHTGSDSDVHRQEFAREVQAWGAKQNVEIRQADVMRFLGHIGLFIRGERSDTGHATAEAQRRGLSFTHKDTAKNGYAYAVGKLTPAGQDYAWKRITKYVAEHGTLQLPRELRGGDSA